MLCNHCRSAGSEHCNARLIPRTVAAADATLSGSFCAIVRGAVPIVFSDSLIKIVQSFLHHYRSYRARFQHRFAEPCFAETATKTAPQNDPILLLPRRMSDEQKDSGRCVAESVYGYIKYSCSTGGNLYLFAVRKTSRCLFPRVRTRVRCRSSIL